jgi:glycosyltransferase involved in cell wall biosynthesis
MRIGIDGSRAFLSKRTGIEEYSYQVVSHLRNRLRKEKVFLYLKKGQSVDFELPVNWKIKVIKWPRFWTQIGLSLEMLFYPVDMLFVPAHTVPLIHPKNTIVVIHGLEYEVFPGGYSFWGRLYMRLSVRYSCRAAKKIIAVSKNTRKDLMELYGISENKIEVIYEGAPEKYQISNVKFQTLPAGRQLNPKLQIKNCKPYLLFVGRLEKRKNIGGIIEAYDILKEKYKIPHKLVLAGNPGYGYEDLKMKIEESKFKKDIFETGYINEESKQYFLKNAEAFLFPTFYEGFGLPVLEAQGAGAPVVTSNISSMPEVGGDGAAYCDPYEPETILDAVWKILNDEEYKDRLVERGFENARKFSWDACADSVSKLLND